MVLSKDQQEDHYKNVPLTKPTNIKFAQPKIYCIDDIWFGFTCWNWKMGNPNQIVKSKNDTRFNA